MKNANDARRSINFPPHRKANSFPPAGSNYGVFMDVKNPANGFEPSWREGKCTNLAALQTAAAAAALGGNC